MEVDWAVEEDRTEGLLREDCVEGLKREAWTEGFTGDLIEGEGEEEEEEMEDVELKELSTGEGRV
jgi:hypothetical protein